MMTSVQINGFKTVTHFIKVTFLVLLFLPVTCIQGQDNVNEPSEIREAFIQAFNSRNLEDLKALFSESKKMKPSVEKIHGTLTRVANVAGPITSMQLEKASGKSYTYRCEHKNLAILKVVFDLDQEGRLAKIDISNNYVIEDAPVLERNQSDLILPFHGKWNTFWGGKTTRQNYHNATPASRGAYDFWVMGPNGKSHRNSARSNEDFYAFGKEIIAPSAGKVIFVSDGIKDNNWPSMNRDAAYGNAVLLETAHKEYMIFAHLKQNSIVVKEGQIVKQGELLGLCGNSGNSTEPHLHFQMHNLPYLTSVTGAWTYFKEIKVNGKTQKDYMPTKGDIVSN